MNNLANKSRISRAENSTFIKLSSLVTKSLMIEIDLTPKPGLVDLHNNGAHLDMNLKHFYQSIQAIEPWFNEFLRSGFELKDTPNSFLLAQLRFLGKKCEADMYKATGGINTHKGAIFAFGLVCGAIGRLIATGRKISVDNICNEVGVICFGLVDRELNNNKNPQTAGERLYLKFGFTGARGEAELGFPIIRIYALPKFFSLSVNNVSTKNVLIATLLEIIAHNFDTNVLNRSGLEGLQWLQEQSRQLLNAPDLFSSNWNKQLIEFDKRCIEKNISPGGSADLLALTYFFSEIIK